MISNMQWEKEHYQVSTDFDRLDISFIQQFLSSSYWAAEIPEEVVRSACNHSLCFGIYDGNDQVGFGRVVTDYTTFAFVADVFVLEQHRGKGLATWLLECMQRHPQLQGLRRWMLATRDAHDLYAKHGFTPLKNPDWFMEIANPDIYRKGNSA
jgi:GNAT superfamily N-acetyltransferase